MTFPTRLKEIAGENGVGLDKVEVWFDVEARVGQKNQIASRWAKRGSGSSDPEGSAHRLDLYFQYDLPQAGQRRRALPPTCNAFAMSLPFAEITKNVPPDAQGVLLVDRTRRRMTNKPIVPACITIVPLPANAPNSTRRRTFGSSCAAIGYRSASSNPTTTSSTIAVARATNSSINAGASCPPVYATGRMGLNQ